MRRVVSTVRWLAALGLASAATAGEAETNAGVRVVVSTREGSRIVGSVAAANVLLHAEYARIALPLRLIRRLDMRDDRETASIEMANGDSLRGVADMPAWRLETSFGAVTVKVEHVLAVQVCSGPGLTPALRDGLALHYAFDGEGTERIEDGGGAGLHGQAKAVKWTRDGRSGGAGDFDGRTSYITTPVVDSTGEVTWSVWIKPRTFPTVHNTFGQFLGARGRAWAWNSDNTSLSFACQDHHGGSRLALQFVVQGSPTTAGSVVHVFPALPEAGVWHHVAGVLDARGMLLYMDGRLLARSADTIKLGSPCAFIIGANDNGPQRYFDGLIDEVMIFRKALSAGEIGDLFASGR
jgi:hypothetical protein